MSVRISISAFSILHIVFRDFFAKPPQNYLLNKILWIILHGWEKKVERKRLILTLQRVSKDQKCKFWKYLITEGKCANIVRIVCEWVWEYQFYPAFFAPFSTNLVSLESWESPLSNDTKFVLCKSQEYGKFSKTECANTKKWKKVCESSLKGVGHLQE